MGDGDHGGADPREAVLEAVIRVTAALGTLFLLVAALRGLRTLLVSLAYVGPAVALLVVLALVRGRYHTRARAYVLTLFAVGAIGLAAVGPLPGNYGVLTASIVIGAILLGRAAALFLTAGAAGISVAAGLGHAHGVLASVGPEMFAAEALSNWLRFTVSFLVVVLAMVLPVRYLIDQLERRAAQEHELVEALRREQARRSELEAARLRAEQMALEAEKFEALGRMAGGIAHDMRNQLALIRTAAHLAAQATTPAAQAQELAAIGGALAQAEAMSALLLAVARRETGDPVLSPLTEATQQAIDQVRPLLPATVRLTATTPVTPPVWLAARELDRIVQHLVLNARDAVSPDGRIVVELRIIPVGALAAEAQLVDRDHVALVVGDDGPGFAPEVRARLFEPFFTTKGALGTGLGLATVRGIALQRRGWIQVGQAAAGGAEVTVAFPVGRASDRPLAPAAQPSVEGAAAAAPAPDRPGDGQRVLIVDDDPLLGRATARLFESLGFRPLLADSGDRAVEVFSAEPAIDLVCTDCRMPGMPCLDLIRLLRARRRGLPIVLYSGFLDVDVIDQRHALGFAFLNKPFTVDELRGAIAAARGLVTATPGRVGGA